MVTMRLYVNVTRNCIGKLAWKTDSENIRSETNTIAPDVAKCWRLWSSSP